MAEAGLAVAGVSGFPDRSLFSYNDNAKALSPFLVLDFGEREGIPEELGPVNSKDL